LKEVIAYEFQFNSVSSQFRVQVTATIVTIIAVGTVQVYSCSNVYSMLSYAVMFHCQVQPSENVEARLGKFFNSL